MGEAALLTWMREEYAFDAPSLAAALDADRSKTWELLENASYHAHALLEPDVIEHIARRVDEAPATLYGILHHVAERDPSRARALIDLFVSLFARAPAAAINEAYYIAANDPHLLRREIVALVCEHFAADAYHAYSVLLYSLRKRPELVETPAIEAAIGNISHASNYAFGFFHEVLKLRPEFTQLCTLALFDCLAVEPPRRSRPEMLQDIMSISSASHVKSDLERALREPPSIGSRRARVLMAILFRQKLRSKQWVLLEALRHAATAMTWGEPQWTPVWDFFWFIVDNSGEDSVSSAAAERFLEGAFQLTYLVARPIDFDEFVRKLDLREPPRAPWPSSVAFLAADAELSSLYDTLSMLAERFGVEPRLAPIREFEGRALAVEEELSELEKRIAAAEPERRSRMEQRREGLERRLTWMRSSEYRAAFSDAAAEARLTPEARDSVRHERRALVKRLRDALRFSAVRTALEALEKCKMDLYQAKLRAVLGREVDILRSAVQEEASGPGPQKQTRRTASSSPRRGDLPALTDCPTALRFFPTKSIETLRGVRQDKDKVKTRWYMRWACASLHQGANSHGTHLRPRGRARAESRHPFRTLCQASSVRERQRESIPPFVAGGPRGSRAGWPDGCHHRMEEGPQA